MNHIRTAILIAAAISMYVGLTAMTFAHEVDQASSDEDLKLFCNDVSELPSFLDSDLCKEVRGEL